MLSSWWFEHQPGVTSLDTQRKVQITHFAGSNDAMVTVFLAGKVTHISSIHISGPQASNLMSAFSQLMYALEIDVEVIDPV